MTSAKKKRPKRIKKARITKIFIEPADDMLSENKEDEEEGGMFLEKGDIQIIYNSLRGYKPTEEEEQRCELLLEGFEEILVVDYNEPYQDVN